MRVSSIGAATVDFEVGGLSARERGLACRRRRGSGSTKAARFCGRLAGYDSRSSRMYWMTRAMTRIAMRMRIFRSGFIELSFLLMAHRTPVATPIYAPTLLTLEVFKSLKTKAFSELSDLPYRSLLRRNRLVEAILGGA